MATLVKVGTANDLKDGQAKVVNANGTEIALYNVKGKYFATQNNCLHRNGPLGEGALEGETITCPWHGWQYDVKTGENQVSKAIKLQVYKVEVKGEELFIEV